MCNVCVSGPLYPSLSVSLSLYVRAREKETDGWMDRWLDGAREILNMYNTDNKYIIYLLERNRERALVYRIDIKSVGRLRIAW